MLISIFQHLLEGSKRNSKKPLVAQVMSSVSNDVTCANSASNGVTCATFANSASNRKIPE